MDKCCQGRVWALVLIMWQQHKEMSHLKSNKLKMNEVKEDPPKQDTPRTDMKPVQVEWNHMSVKMKSKKSWNKRWTMIKETKRKMKKLSSWHGCLKWKWNLSSMKKMRGLNEFTELGLGGACIGGGFIHISELAKGDEVQGSHGRNRQETVGRGGRRRLPEIWKVVCLLKAVRVEAVLKNAKLLDANNLGDEEECDWKLWSNSERLRLWASRRHTLQGWQLHHQLPMR